MIVAPANRADCRRLLISQLKLPPTTAVESPADPIIAEYLRAGLVAPTQSRNGNHPVYVTALANQVRSQLVTLWPELWRARNQRPSQFEQRSEGDTAPDPIRRVLQSLADLRDAIHIGNGYWMPGPLRLVELSTDTTLVIGGMPTADIRALCKDVRLDWIARRVATAAITEDLRGDGSHWQQRTGWLGTPPESLEEWTRLTLEDARRSLAVSAADQYDFEIYSPWHKRQDVQTFRWIDAREAPRSGYPDLVLCRTRGSGFIGPRRYWIGAIKRNDRGWRVDREAGVDPSDARRMQYGFDLLARAPIAIKQQKRSKDMHLTFRDLVPAEERRLLIACCEDVSARPGKFPLVYSVSHAVYPAVHSALLGLGVRITT